MRATIFFSLKVCTVMIQNQRKTVLIYVLSFGSDKEGNESDSRPYASLHVFDVIHYTTSLLLL